MNIGILATTEKINGGVYQYTQSLVESLLRYTDQTYLIIRNSESIVSEISCLDNTNNFNEITIEKSTITRKIKSFLNLCFPMCRRLFDVSNDHKYIKNYNLNLIINPVSSFFSVSLRTPYIVIIHDLIHIHHPEFVPLIERYRRKYFFKIIAKKAVLLVCESNVVKQDIKRYLNIPEKNIRVIISPPPLNKLSKNIEPQKTSQIKAKYNLPCNFIFFPAQFWPHKNHKNLINAIYHLKHTYGETVHLVLVGSKQKHFNNIKNKIESLNLEKDISILGYIPDEDMPYLYKLATALVMPTFFESVSLPIWEAFYFGLPVISSNVCALPEQVMDAGILFDPNDVKDIAEKIYRIWTNESQRNELKQKGYKRIKDLTIENYAKQWTKVINDAFDRLQEKRF